MRSQGYGVLFAIALLLAAHLPAHAQTPKDAFVKAICGPSPAALTPAPSFSGSRLVFAFRADGTMTNSTTSASANSLLTFWEFGSDVLVRISQPVASRSTARILACGTTKPKETYVLPNGIDKNVPLVIDVFRIDQAAAEDFTKGVYKERLEAVEERISALKANPAATQLFAPDEEKKRLEKKMAACVLTQTPTRLSHQELVVDGTLLYAVRYEDTGEYKRVPKERAVWLVVTDVPGSVELTVVQKAGDEIGFTLFSLAKLLLPWGAKLVPYLNELDAGPDCPAPPEPLSTTRVHLLKTIDNLHTSVVSICADTKCPGEKDANVKASLKLVPSPKGRWTVMTELSFGLGFAGSRLADGANPYGLRSQSTPQFDPVLGANGPEQVFELRERTNPRNAFTASVLVGKHVSDEWFMGAGSSLVIGANGAALSQLGFRLGRDIKRSGVYVTFGPSARFVDAPEFYAIGDRVTVSQSAGTMASAPKFATHVGVEFQFDVGLAIDLGTLVTSAASVISSFGGGSK